MKPMTLNLSKMRKIDGDEKSSTFLHDAGHKIIIAHAPLPAIQREQLKRLPVLQMADGGAATYADQIQKFKDSQSGGGGGGGESSESQTNAAADKKTNDARARLAAKYGSQMQSQAQGGLIQRFAEGTPDEPVQAPDKQGVTINIGAPPQLPASALNPNPGSQAGPAIETMTPEQMAVQHPPGMITSEQMAQLQQAHQDQVAPQAPAPIEAPAPSAAPAASAPAAPAPAPQAGPTGTPSIEGISPASIYNQGMEANQAQLGAETQLADQQAKVQSDYQKTLAAQQFHFQQGLDQKTKEIDSVLGDIKKGHINANHYMESMKTPERVATAIGLFLGGFSTPFTHQGNPAMQFLQDQINRDVEAQKADLGNKHNLLTGYMEQYKNMGAAENMARATQYGIYASKLQEAAATAATPMAKARALQGAALLQQQMLPLVQAAQFMQSNQVNSGSSAVDYNKLNGLQRTGIMSKEDVAAATKEATQLEEARSMRNDFNQAFQHLDKKFLAGDIPGMRGDRESAIWTLAGKLQHASAGRFNLEDAKKQMDAMFPAAGDRASTREDRLKNSNRLFDDLEAATPTLNRYGLKTQASLPDPMEGKIAVSPNGARVIMKGGKWVPFNG